MILKVLRRMRKKPVFGWVIGYSLCSTSLIFLIFALPVAAPSLKAITIILLAFPSAAGVPFLELYLTYRERSTRRFSARFLRMLPMFLLIILVGWFNSPSEYQWKILSVQLSLMLPIFLNASWCARMTKLGYI